MFINARELWLFPNISEGIYKSTHEESLAYSVCKRLEKIPTNPVYLIDAVVRYSELSSEKGKSSLEEETVSSSCFDI